MDWKPKAWLAALLALLLQWPGMLYLMRPGWALVYLIVPLILALALFAVPVALQQALALSLMLVPLICAAHAYLLARRARVATRRWYSRWHGMIALWLGSIAAIVLVRSFLFEPFRLPSTAMFPSLPKGSLLVVRKFGFGNYGTFGITLSRRPITKALARGDVIVFEPPHVPDQTYVKRIVGLPGDEVRIAEGALSVNGSLAEAQAGNLSGDRQIFQEALPGGQWSIARRLLAAVPSPEGVWEVPEDHYFVLGDNRDNSEDSRHWGFVPADHVIGRVQWVFTPAGAPE